MQTESAKFKLSGDPAQTDRFFIELAQTGIPFKANGTFDMFTIAEKYSAMFGALASILSITLCVVD